MKRKKGSGLWQMVFPRQGVWYHVTDTAKAATVYLKLNELYQVTRIEAMSICSGDMRKWVLNTQDQITRFHAYLLHRIGHDDLRIRVRAKKRHHPPTKLLP